MMIKTKLVTIIALIFTFSSIKAQSNISTSLKRNTSFYPNGSFKKIETFLIDSCKIYDWTNNRSYYCDTCRYGLIQEYYPNGTRKLSGQYDCELMQQDDDTLKYYYQCFKTGIWCDYDSLGNINKATKYNQGWEVSVKYPLKQDTLAINKDSVWIKIKSYTHRNSYLIRRKKNNKHLILEFPMLSGHNYWSIYDRRIDMFTIGGTLFSWGKPLFYFKDDDTGKRQSQQHSFDFSKLKNGVYYVYYEPMAPTYFYEIEIVLEDF